MPVPFCFDLSSLDDEFSTAEQSVMGRWLDLHRVPAGTFCTYRLELTRLKIWCKLEHRVSIVSLTRDDWERYVEFLSHPPSKMIGYLKAPYGTPEWRPFFRSGLKVSALRTSLSVCSALCLHFILEGAMSANLPRLVMREANWERPSPEGRVPALSLTEIEMVRDYAAGLPDDLDNTRLAFLVELFLAGFRVSELANERNMMSAFGDAVRSNGSKVFVHTKGEDVRCVTVEDSRLIDAMLRYRFHLGLSPTFSAEEEVPMIVAHDCSVFAPITRQAIFGLIKKLLADVADYIEEAMAEPGCASRIRASSIESLRVGVAAGKAESEGVLAARIFLGQRDLTNMPALDRRILVNHNPNKNQRKL